MILGTVGTHTAGFDRLVRELDTVADRVDQRVVIQIGTSGYIPQHAEWFRMTTSERMLTYIRTADVIVTHAADSLLEALIERKRVVAVPRQSRFGEHIDDHQVDLGRKLHAKLGLPVVENIGDLWEALTRSPYEETVTNGNASRMLVAALHAAIDDLR